MAQAGFNIEEIMMKDNEYREIIELSPEEYRDVFDEYYEMYPATKKLDYMSDREASVLYNKLVRLNNQKKVNEQWPDWDTYSRYHGDYDRYLKDLEYLERTYR